MNPSIDVAHAWTRGERSTTLATQMYRPAMAVIVVAGILLLVWITQIGVGVSPDSVVYLRAADHIARGDGFVIETTDWNGQRRLMPIAHWQPLFPAVLSIPIRAGANGQSAARWFHVVLFAATILLAGAIVRTTTGSPIAALCGAALFATSRPLLQAYSMALSEPLFLIATLVMMISLVRYATSARWAWLAVASSAIAVAWMTRYAGAAWAVVAAAVVVLFARRSMRSLTIGWVTIAVIAGLPAVVWTLRNLDTAGTATHRHWHFNPLVMERLVDGCETIGGWLVPASFPEPVRFATGVLVILITVGAGIRTHRAAKRSAEPSSGTALRAWLVVLGLTSGAYVALIVVACAFLDSGIALDNRMLSPLAVTGILAASMISHDALRRLHDRRRRRVVISTVLLGAACFWCAKAASWSPVLAKSGQWYSGVAWQQSELCRLTAKIAPDIPIWSNAADAVQWITGRSARPLPAAHDAARLQDFAALARRTDGRVVWFHTASWRSHYPTMDELVGKAQMQIFKTTSDGVLLGAK